MGGLFSQPKTPAPKPVATMPDQDSDAVREAARRKNMDIMSRAGRSSTILTKPEDRGGDYSGSKLGSN